MHHCLQAQNLVAYCKQMIHGQGYVWMPEEFTATSQSTLNWENNAALPGARKQCYRILPPRRYRKVRIFRSVYKVLSFYLLKRRSFKLLHGGIS